MSTLLLRHAEVDGGRLDVRIDGATVVAIGPVGSLPGADETIDCGGGALLPGLHDHHLHLLAMAAAMESVDVTDNLDHQIRTADALAPPGAWIRAVNYDEGRDGPLDRWRLDALVSTRPVRVQHRSGAAWILNSVALVHVAAAASAGGGIERDHALRPTGRLFGLDEWLRARLPDAGAGDVAAVGRRLAAFGITGATDCTPTSGQDYFDVLASAVRTGGLPLTIAVTGGPDLSDVDPPHPLRRGPVKIVLTDHDFPELHTLMEWFQRAHRIGRPVAVHCVTRASLVLAVAAWKEIGSRPGDRVEHASVAPLDLVSDLAELSVTVVTQPAFLAARGDDYLRQVDAADRPDLYRCASLLTAGVAVAGSTDAPFGPDDPWVAVGAAVDRRSPSGVLVGEDTGLSPAAALDLFLAPLEQPGGPVRRIEPGAAADLCLLDRSLRAALLEPSSRHVAMTMAGGRRTFMS